MFPCNLSSSQNTDAPDTLSDHPDCHCCNAVIQTHRVHQGLIIRPLLITNNSQFCCNVWVYLLTIGSRPWILWRLISTVMSQGRSERGLGVSLWPRSSRPSPVQPDEEEQELSTGLESDSSKSVYMSSSPK